MNYFTIKKSFFLVPSKECCEEIEKIDKFLYILEKSGIGTIIEKAYKKDKIVDCGRKSYNPFNMFAMVVFCSAMFDNSLRNLEELCKFDLRVMYIMEQEPPDHSVIGDFINMKFLL